MYISIYIKHSFTVIIFFLKSMDFVLYFVLFFILSLCRDVLYMYTIRCHDEQNVIMMSVFPFFFWIIIIACMHVQIWFIPIVITSLLRNYCFSFCRTYCDTESRLAGCFFLNIRLQPTVLSDMSYHFLTNEIYIC